MGRDEIRSGIRGCTECLGMCRPNIALLRQDLPPCCGTPAEACHTRSPCAQDGSDTGAWADPAPGDSTGTPSRGHADAHSAPPGQGLLSSHSQESERAGLQEAACCAATCMIRGHPRQSHLKLARDRLQRSDETGAADMPGNHPSGWQEAACRGQMRQERQPHPSFPTFSTKGRSR